MRKFLADVHPDMWLLILALALAALCWLCTGGRPLIELWFHSEF